MLFFICPIGVTVFATRFSAFLSGALVMFSSGFAANVSNLNDSCRSFYVELQRSKIKMYRNSVEIEKPVKREYVFFSRRPWTLWDVVRQTAISATECLKNIGLILRIHRGHACAFSI